MGSNLGRAGRFRLFLTAPTLLLLPLLLLLLPQECGCAREYCAGHFPHAVDD